MSPAAAGLRRPGRRAGVALAMGVALLLCGCNFQYGSPGGKPPVKKQGAAAHVARIESTVRANGSDARALRWMAPCTLEIHWRSGAIERLDPLTVEMVVDTDPVTGKYYVLLRPPGADKDPELLISTDDWADLAVVRTELNMVRGVCAWGEGRE